MSYDIFQGVESVKYITGSDRKTGARCIGRQKEPPDRKMSIWRFFVCTEFPGIDFSMER